MNNRTFVSAATLAASILCSTAAWAIPNTWTPISGAAFRPSEGTPGLPEHVAGHVINYTAQTSTVEASLGHFPGVTQRFYIYGFNNGGQLTCDIEAYPDGQGGFHQLDFRATTSVNGYFMLPIDTFTYTSPNPNYFYMIQCTLPPTGLSSASIFGVTGNAGTVLLFTPQSRAGFVPISYTPGGSIFETSLGHGGGGQIGFVVQGILSSGTLACYVYAWSSAGGIVQAGTASTSSPGRITMNVIANVPTGTDYFYTMRCQIPPGMDLRGVWPGK